MQFNSEAGTDAGRPDIVGIDLPPVPGGEQMPAVQFLHDRHTEALKGEKDCSACHQQMIGKSQKAGPVNCEGCHDPAEQKKIQIVEKVPRLKRNQPDQILLARWIDESDQDLKSIKTRSNPVAFNHQAHELMQSL